MRCDRYLMFAILVASFAVRAAAAEAPESQTFDAKGVKIHYVTAGQGEPVVLIHGLHSSALMNWQLPGVFNELAKEYRVIALDLPGHGRSDKPERAEAYGVQLVDDVALLLDHLKIDKAHVVGYSLGGMVTAKFAVMHPERVLSATLGGMGWLKEGSPPQSFWERIPTRPGNETSSIFMQNMAKLAVTEDDLKGIKLPVEVIVGNRDPVKRLYVTPLEQVRSDWPVVEIDGAGHITCIMKREFRDAIVAWLRKNKQSKSAT
jgi:pimeloyl-ACP methyl ester carboxylesterase